ncbi:MAG TPA: hypothetical protein VGL53_12825 [Bryobacteraceae bacterium]|jgi:hypothetical protein
MSNMPPPLPPQQPQYMGGPLPPKKGLSGCAIAAIIVGVLCVLVVVGIGVGGYVFVKQVGGKAGIVKSAFAVANPDYDILEVNETAKTITVRHKKTGKSATIEIANLKNGRIDPADLGLTSAEAEGTGDAPPWVKYPNARLVTSAHVFTITTLVYRTTDSVDKAMDYYKAEVGKQGLQATAEGSGAIVASDAKGELKIAINRRATEDATVISIIYRAK